jgi:hypothetical protein
VSDDEDRELRMEWLRMQLTKAEFDMQMELRKLKRQSITIAISVVAAMAASLAAGAAALGLILHWMGKL